MWMMGYSDGGGEINTIQDPFTGRKLRPLMPRPTAAAAAAPPCLTRIHGTDLFALNHHLGKFISICIYIYMWVLCVCVCVFGFR